jgi:PAS domain S-box-containing protein
VNDAACRSLGYSRDELLTMCVYDVDAGFPRESWTEHWQNVKQHGSITWESEHRAKDGRLLPVEIKADFVEYEGEEYLCALARDITERKQQEQALRESQEALRASEVRYRTLVENSYDVISLFSDEGHVLYTSPSIKRVLGYEPEERIGTQGLDIVHPDDVKPSLAIFEKALRSPGTVAQYVLRLRHKDGSYRTVECTGTNLLDEPGFHAMVSIFRDITEQRQAEEALRSAYDEVEQRVRQRTGELAAANRQLRADNAFRAAVVNRAAEGLCVCHEVDEFPFVRFTVWSDRMTEITGYTRKQINRLGWYQTLYRDEAVREAAIERMAGMRYGNDLRGEEWEITRADGEKRTLLISTSLLDTGEGTPQVLAVMQDITERARMERALRESEEALRRSERLASVGTLAAGIAHEINNPLGAITLSIETALAAEGRPDQQQILKAALAHIRTSALRCGRIVRSVLQLARNEESEKSPGDLGEVLRYAGEQAARIAEQKGVRVKIHISDDLPALVMASAEMGQVFTNLIVNAVQASEPGGRVTVRSRMASEGLQVLVEDQGCGIRREELERIFDPFYTVRRHEGGTGLGLSISHRIVQEHGGAIHAESTPGEGTTMRVVLPLR